MDEDRRGAYRDRLPEASDAFEQAILRGGEDIRRYERRRRRAPGLALVAAAIMLLAVGLGVAVSRLNAPKPDNVALSVNPESVVTEAEKARLRAERTPESTQEPEADARSRVDPDSGWEYLLDDGPFGEGEWLVVTDADGCLSYGLVIPFREKPSDQARSVEMNAGMQVRYLGEAENGFARVDFAGRDGYVALENLRRGAETPALAAGHAWYLDMAELFMVDSLGKAHVFQVNSDGEKLACYALQRLLETMTPLPEGLYPDVSYGGMLLARYQDADIPMTFENGAERFVEVRYALPANGDFLLRTEDGSRYYLPNSQDRFFWSVFPEAEALIWQAGEPEEAG